MEIKLTFEKINIVAWWGAVVATIVLLWDIYKWKASGPRVFIRVSPNMSILGVPKYEGETYVTVRVNNLGSRQTTITNLYCSYYRNWFLRFLRKPRKSFVVANPGISFPLPYVLQPGTEWNGIILQDEIEEWAKEGILICELYISDKKRPITNQISIPISKD